MARTISQQEARQRVRTGEWKSPWELRSTIDSQVRAFLPDKETDTFPAEAQKQLNEVVRALSDEVISTSEYLDVEDELSDPNSYQLMILREPTYDIIVKVGPTLHGIKWSALALMGAILAVSNWNALAILY